MKTNAGSLKVAAAKEVLRCFLLIMFLHFFFAIAISKITQDTEVGEEYFPNVVQGMQSLRDVSDVAGALLAESKACFIPYLAFFVRCSVVVILTLKNILVQIRTIKRAQPQCTSAPTDNNSEEIAERV